MTEKYPENLYRGVSSLGDITKEGYVMAGAFKFDAYDGNLRDDDGFCELSINWNDDDDSLHLLLGQHKPFKEEKQFKAGYCKIERALIDLMLKQYIDAGRFKYERRPIEANPEQDIQANPYHGNLLMLNDLDKNTKKNIQHSLATLAGSIIRRSVVEGASE